MTQAGLRLVECAQLTWSCSALSMSVIRRRWLGPVRRMFAIVHKRPRHGELALLLHGNIAEVDGWLRGVVAPRLAPEPLLWEPVDGDSVLRVVRKFRIAPCRILKNRILHTATSQKSTSPCGGEEGRFRIPDICRV